MTDAPQIARVSLPRRAGQRGLVMWVALVVLIVMTLTGLAMLRQMGGGVSIAGNVAFKQNATASADSGIETGRAWLIAQTTATLEGPNLPALGYYSTWGPTVDPAAFPWAGGSVPVALDAGLGNNALYIIHRLCLNPGSVNAVTQVCSDIEDTYGSSRGVPGYGEPPATPSFKPFFRVTTQVTGPRNTISYTQVVLN